MSFRYIKFPPLAFSLSLHCLKPINKRCIDTKTRLTLYHLCNVLLQYIDRIGVFIVHNCTQALAHVVRVYQSAFRHGRGFAPVPTSLEGGGW